MTRIPDRPVAVRLDSAGRPAAFRWRGRWRGVTEVVDEWVYRQPWWEESIFGDGSGRPLERTFYRVLADGGGMFELALAAGGRAWLYREFD